jgi:hypothetical protein
MYTHVQACKLMDKLHSYTLMYNHVYTHVNSCTSVYTHVLYKHVHSCTSMYTCVQACTIVYKHVH